MADILWFLGQHEVLARYPGRVVILLNRTVVGSGRDSLEALEDARRQARARGEQLPGPSELLFIPIPESIDSGPESVPIDKQWITTGETTNGA
jgi:hypothetical protein